MIEELSGIADERIGLNMGLNVDKCLVSIENETRQEFLTVNANEAKGPDGLTGKIKKKNKKKKHVHHNCVI